ncbi:hypothetical protein PILCRDRAFT_820242, partial [Piloderma croceum F 1598]
MSFALFPRPIPPALRPPPNTPLSPTFPTALNPLPISREHISTLHEEAEEEEEEEGTDPNTLSSYGLLTPSETYTPTTPSLSPLTSSPKRHPHSTLRLRLPIRRPPLPSRRIATGYGGYAGWSRPRIVIGGNTSLPSSPVPITQTPMKVKKWTYPGYLSSSPSPTSPSPSISISASTSTPPQHPTSPAPLPIRLRPIPLTQHMSLSASNALLPAHLRLRPVCVGVGLGEGMRSSDSDSETEVEDEDDKQEEGDASDTCASDSDSDGEVYDSSYSPMDRKIGVTSYLQNSARTTTTKLKP